MIDLDKYEGHTPGPWAVSPFDSIWSDETRVTQMPNVIGTTRQMQLNANAQLIAAAPELLAEVKRLRADLADVVECLRAAAEELKRHTNTFDFDDVIAKHGGGK